MAYCISNLPSMGQDIQKRSYFLKKAISLLDRKADMDLCYASTLDNLIAKDYLKPVNISLPSQFLYKSLVSLVQEEAKRMRRSGQQIRIQMLELQRSYDTQQPEVKKWLMVAQSTSREMASVRQKLERSRVKFERRNKELEQSKVEYLSSYLSNEQLQRKNQLYLQVNSLEEITRPLREDYEYLAEKYNGLVNASVQQFKTMLGRMEVGELRKTMALKGAVSSYLQMQKETIDQLLRRNPFMKADIDSVRERDELVPHTDDILNDERENLLSPFLNDSQYVDSIYDRIETKKNLEQIIVYGQEREHKSELSEALNGAAESKLNIKTLRMTTIFKHVFELQATGEMLGELSDIFQHDEKMRKDFILCLQRYRINNKFELPLRNKESILECINIFLNTCHEELDTYNSKMLMVLSLTYHFRQDQRSVELQQLISDHKIWKRMGWWQSALLESIFEQTRVKVRREELPITIWDIKAGGVSRKEEGQEVTHQHICFNQLLYYVRNMGLFHLPPNSILSYARFNISLLKFTGKFAKDILDLCPPHNSPQIQK